MAKNLRAKIPASDALIIHDRNKEATGSFVNEVGIAGDSPSANNELGLMGIEVASTPRAVAEKAVGLFVLLFSFQRCNYDEHVSNKNK